ncbi:hypothetical protein Tco_0810519, partial [Tanacetum coccineum]
CSNITYDAPKRQNGRGKKAMAMSPLSRLISIFKSVEGEENGNVAAELCRLKKHYKKAIEGLGKVLSRDTQAPARNPTTNRDTSGMVRRTKGTTCKGYDYYNPVRVTGVDMQHISGLEFVRLLRSR